MSASFSSTLISDGTPANQIDDKMMILLANIVGVLAGAPWGTDVNAISPVFDFYESGTDEGYFGTLRMRGDATANGVRIRDMVNSEEFRLFVADVAGTPTFKIQHYSGVETETPSWTDLLEVDATKIAHDSFVINPENTSGSIKGYIDQLIQEVYDYIGGGVAGVSSITAGNLLVANHPTGDVSIGIAATGNNGQSVQMDSGVVAWRDQALPAFAHCYDNGTISNMGDGSWYQVPLTAIQVVRGGVGLNANSIDIPYTGEYFINFNLTVVQSSGGDVSFETAIRKSPGAVFISTNTGAVVCPSDKFVSANVSILAYLTASETVEFAIKQTSGSTLASAGVVVSVDIMRLH